MRKMGLLLIVGVTLAATLASAFGVWHDEDPARADPPLVVGLDMDPTDNFCSGPSSDCTLGPIDQCVSVPNTPGTEFQVDLWVNGLDFGFALFNENIYYPSSPPDANPVLILQADDTTNAGFILTAQSAGSIAVNTSEAVPDPGSLQVTDDGSPHHISVSESGTFETSPPFTKGVVARLTFAVAEGAASGIYGLTLDGPPLATYLDKDLTAYEVSAKWDANFDPQYGLVAIGQACPGVSVTPTATPTVSPTATPTVSPTATPAGTPTPGTVPLVVGWNDACYQGQAQPIADAFAFVMANVQAVYRMKPDQGFDRWFPTRPELSTIATLSSFDQLFILMSTSTDWTTQPVAQPPVSAALNSGWNSTCYLGGTKDTAAAAASISGGFSIIYSLPSDQVWRRFVPGQPDVSNLAQLETFTSVLILMTDPTGGTWTFSP